MPTYEYRCCECQARFVERERIDQHETRAGTSCPHCRSPQVERVLSDFYARTPRKS